MAADTNTPQGKPPFVSLWRAIVGAPKQIRDPHLFHKMSLIPVLALIFAVFIITPLVMLLDGIFTHTDRFAPLVNDFHAGISKDVSIIGVFGILLLFLRAYSLGDGTCTGIEAVSNGMQIMREPGSKPASGL